MVRFACEDTPFRRDRQRIRGAKFREFGRKPYLCHEMILTDPQMPTPHIYAAPLQGFTEAPWRVLHHQLFGGVDAYYTPFVRVERGEFRAKDVRDIDPLRNLAAGAPLPLVPQMIASTPDEMERLIALFQEKGYTKADLNLGCPFPLQARLHRGAGILPYPAEVVALCQVMHRHPEMRFSVKMRLGWEDTDEWQRILPLFDSLPLTRVTLHPRVGRQQYKGTVDRTAFALFARACRHPLVYNGDLTTADQVRQVMQEFPQLEGVMLGRGLLARPCLAEEVRSGRTWSREELYARVSEWHTRLWAQAEATLQGEAQLLMKVKPYWEYLLPDLEKKHRKAILKATRADKYLMAVRDALRQR
jgi:tRNA-dihydrouridine synthase